MANESMEELYILRLKDREHNIVTFEQQFFKSNSGDLEGIDWNSVIYGAKGYDAYEIMDDNGVLISSGEVSEDLKDIAMKATDPNQKDIMILAERIDGLRKEILRNYETDAPNFDLSKNDILEALDTGEISELELAINDMKGYTDKNTERLEMLDEVRTYSNVITQKIELSPEDARIMFGRGDYEEKEGDPIISGLFSVENPAGEKACLMVDAGINLDQLLDKIASSKDNYGDLLQMGKRMDEAEFAEFEQSERCAFSVEYNMNNEQMSIYEINSGKGGINEANRNESNVSIKKMNMSDYKKEDVGVSELHSKEDLQKALIQGVKKTLDGEEFARWCQKQSHLFYNRYTFRNAFLTFLQNPNATYVCGYEKWKEYGRQVLKGAKAIKIYKPEFIHEDIHEDKKGSLYHTVKKNCSEMLKKDPNLEYATFRYQQSNLYFVMYRNNLWDVRANNKLAGAHLTEEQTKKLIDTAILGKAPISYGVTRVFDISQTTDKCDYLYVNRASAKDEELVLDKEGNPIRNREGKVKIKNSAERISKFPETSGTDIPESNPKKMQILYECLQSVSNQKGIPVNEGSKENDANLSAGALGYFRHPTNEHPKGNIVLDQELPITRKVSVLFHEMAHSDLHADLSKLKEDMNISSNAKISKQMKEMQAEAVAYMSASRFGIETDHESFHYIANWSNGRDLKDLQASLEVIYNESQQLLGMIEKELDSHGYTMQLEPKDLSPKTESEKLEFAGCKKEFSLNATRQAEGQLRDAYAEFKETDLPEEAELLKEQIVKQNNIRKEADRLNEMIDQYENTDDREMQEDLERQMISKTALINNLKKSVDALSEERIEIVRDAAKDDLRHMFVADPMKALKQMRKEYEPMKGLTDIDLKIIAQSAYVKRNYSHLIGKNTPEFVSFACNQLNNLKKSMSRRDCVVEFVYSENVVPGIHVNDGTAAHPKQANSIVKDVEKKIRDFKKNAEKEGIYVPYNKCGVNVISISDKKVTSFYMDPIDVGDGFQNDLSDALNKCCANEEVLRLYNASVKENGRFQERIPSWEHAASEKAKAEQIKEERVASSRDPDSTKSMSHWKEKIDRTRINPDQNEMQDKEMEECKE